MNKTMAIPSEELLLELAAKELPADRAWARQVEGSPAEARLAAIVAELRALSVPPKDLPPRLKRWPGARLLTKVILRLHERVFRKQTMINERIAEALALLAQEQRRR